MLTDKKFWRKRLSRYELYHGTCGYLHYFELYGESILSDLANHEIIEYTKEREFGIHLPSLQRMTILKYESWRRGWRRGWDRRHIFS